MAIVNVAIIGLGRMGEAIACRAMQAGFTVFGYDTSSETRAANSAYGVTVVETLADLAHCDIHVFWLMVPQGIIVDKVIAELQSFIKTGDIIIDGGNSHFSDSLRRHRELALSGIEFLDCGTSGGVHGKENGFCLMIGGSATAYNKVSPLLHAVAMPQGCALVGPSGAGHYVKMVHNGIEYGILQAYAEGFHVLKDGEFKDYELDLEKIAELWNHGSVIRSWILDLVVNVMKEDQKLDDITGVVAATGMGKWTVESAHKSHIPVPVIEASLEVRTQSEKTGGNYATKLVAMLRNQFGGHAVVHKGEE